MSLPFRNLKQTVVGTDGVELIKAFACRVNAATIAIRASATNADFAYLPLADLPLLVSSYCDWLRGA